MELATVMAEISSSTDQFQTARRRKFKKDQYKDLNMVYI
jgi:hypothetical protein